MPGAEWDLEFAAGETDFMADLALVSRVLVVRPRVRSGAGADLKLVYIIRSAHTAQPPPPPALPL